MKNSSNNNNFPPFPNQIIRGLAKEFVDIYEPIRETAPQALWLAFVANLGCLVSPFVRLNAGASEPRFYGVVLGRSARTRKSTALNAAADVFNCKQLQPYLRTIRGFGSSEGLMHDLGERDKAAPVIIHFDEINILAKKTSQDGTNGISALNTLWEDHDYDHPLARGNGYVVRNAYLSIVGASTIDDYVKTWKSQHQDAGFLNRLLLIGVDQPAQSIAIPVDADQKKLDELRKEILELATSVQKAPRQYEFTREAKESWEKFYADRGDSTEWDRIDTYGLRLLAIQTLLEGDDAVTLPTVERVIAFLKYEVAIREVTTPVVAENIAAEMEQLILRQLRKAPESLTKRNLQRCTNANRKGIEVFNRALASLEREGIINVRRSERSVTVTLNPYEDPEETQEVEDGVIRTDDDSYGNLTISFSGTYPHKQPAVIVSLPLACDSTKEV